MLRFIQRSGRHSQAATTRARRLRSFKASLEAMEDRKLLSTLTSVNWTDGITAHSEVFALGFDNTVSVSKDGGSFVSQSGYCKAISAGLDAYGYPEVYAIGGDNGVWVNDNGAGWVSRGGWVSAISASVNDTVFAIGGDNSAYINRGGTNWTGLGGYCKPISAGVDFYGSPEVYAIGGDAAAYVSDNGSGFGKIGGYVTEISGTGMGSVFARGGSVEQVFVSQYSAPFSYIDSVALANPVAASAYSPAPSSAPLFNNNQPSYLDMQQGAAADCWLDASLAEVAARYPQDINNMFVYQGTTVDNGATVGLYSVRFFSPNGIGFYVQVDTALPSGGGYYNRVGNSLGTQSLWTALTEKGYAEANALGLVTTGAGGQGSYASLNYGSPTWALQAITGQASNGYAINPTNIANAWNSGQLIVLCTSTPASSLIVGGHCYAVVGYDASSGNPFEVFNPWGVQSDGYAPGQTGTIFGLFSANSAFLSQNFTSQSIGSGASNMSALMSALTDQDDDTTETVNLKITGPRKLAVLGIDYSNTALGHTRPLLGIMTVGGPLSCR
ncbi:MAG: hypothetical protein NVSMB9_22100 [Isosphaeraceae bacterium]